MQDYPEQIQAPTPDESAETPNWVADASSRTWLARNRTAELRDAPAFSQEQGQVNQNWRQHNSFYTYRGGKPYQAQDNQGVQPVVPMGIPFPDPRPLDEQVNPVAPDAPEGKMKPPAPEARPGGVVIEGNKVLIPTFSLSDPVLDAQHKPKVEAFDIDSPDAKLYLQNRDSIVKITTEKVNSEGKPFTAYASGFFVNETGQIATANHVIEGATSLQVTTAAGKTYTAKVKESHPGSESAVIELTNVAPGEKFRPIPLRDSAADLKPGEKLTVLGHPDGVDEIVMSRGDFASRESFAGTPFSHPGVNPSSMFLHATTRIQCGNSGGPLLDSQGRAVGLTNFKHGDNSGEFVGIDDVRSLVTDSKGKLSDQRSYVFPSSLQFDKDVRYKSFETFVPAVSLANAYFGRNATQLVKFNSAARIATSGMAASVALTDMPGDYSAFKTAWAEGTTAEKMQTGINLSGDVLMFAGSAAAIVSKRYGVLGTAISTLGAGSKLGNALFGDRRYH